MIFEKAGRRVVKNDERSDCIRFMEESFVVMRDVLIEAPQAGD